MYWVSVFMNLFTNVITVVFYLFTRYANKRFVSITDPSTGEKLTEKNKKFELKKVIEMPWVFWTIIAFSWLYVKPQFLSMQLMTIYSETSTAIIFTQNATELAEQRFKTDSITAGWYTSVLQYAGFFVVPILGVFIDVFGNRVSLSMS